MTAEIDKALRYIRRVTLLREVERLCDGELLQRFVTGRDTTALEALNDRNVYLLDTTTGKVRCRLERQVQPRYGRIGFTPDGRFVATTTYVENGDERTMIVSLCDAETGKAKHQCEVPYRPGELTRWICSRSWPAARRRPT